MSEKFFVLESTIGIDAGNGIVYGTLTIPSDAWGVVIFAYGSGSSRKHPRHRMVAEAHHRAGLATLLVDLLTPFEERVDLFTAQHRFNIDLLSQRLSAATDWLIYNSEQFNLPIGYFGSGTGAAAALKSAAQRHDVAAIVSRGGRPELAREALRRVTSPTLLLVGSLDEPFIESNLTAYSQFTRASHRQINVIPGATHLFEEKGALEQVAQLAIEWFKGHLTIETTYRRDRHLSEHSKRAARRTYNTISTR